MLAAERPRVGTPSPTLLLACPPAWTLDPAGNPYRAEFACVLGLLLGVYIVWRSVRPTGHRLLRAYVGVGGAVAFVVMQMQTCMSFDRVERKEGCLLVLELCILATVSLVAELVLASRQPPGVSRAIARQSSERRR